MDLRRLRVGERIAATSGVVLIVSLFLPWSDALSGWQAFSAFDVVLALLGAAALVIVWIVATARAAGPGVAAEALLTPFALVIAIVGLFKITDYDGYGAWIGLAATVGVLVGVLVGMRDERLSKPGRLTDQTGRPVERDVEVETLPAPPPA
jgi:hypothetical protein